jgi:hypothetical protein
MAWSVDWLSRSLQDLVGFHNLIIQLISGVAGGRAAGAAH